jgi:hypothetical protein
VKDDQDVDDLVDEEIMPWFSNKTASVKEREAQDELWYNYCDTSRECCPRKDVDNATNIALPSSAEINGVLLIEALTTTRLNRFGVRIDVQWYLYQVKIILTDSLNDETHTVHQQWDRHLQALPSSTRKLQASQR